MGTRCWTAIIAALSFLFVLAIPDTDALSGALVPIGCIDDNDAPQGEDACLETADGLHAVAALAISPDGRHIYTAAFEDDAIARFLRDPMTGDLTWEACGRDDVTSTEACGSLAGLSGISSIAISPDGKNVYTTSPVDDALLVFTRPTEEGPTFGNLSLLECFDDDDSGTVPSCASTPGLDGAGHVTVSRDGKNVYVTSTGDDAVVTFNRSATDGKLTFASCISDTGSITNDCATQTPGLFSAGQAAASPDGKSVYVAGFGSDTIVRFKRSKATGALSPRGCIQDTQAGIFVCSKRVKGIGFPTEIAISPNGKSLYVTSEDDDALAIFKRSKRSGALKYAGCIAKNTAGDCRRAATGLQGASGLAISPDSKSVYVAGFSDDALVRFNRKKKKGTLSPRGCISDDDTGIAGCAAATAGLDGVTDVIVSPNGQHVYAVSSVDDAVVMIDRL